MSKTSRKISQIRCPICKDYEATKNCTTCGRSVCLICICPKFIKYNCTQGSYAKNDVEYIKVHVCDDCDEEKHYMPHIVDGGDSGACNIM